jgi:hypothetical protein
MVRNLTDVATMPGYIETPSKLESPENEEQEEQGEPEPVLNEMDAGALVNELTNLNLMPKKVDLTPHEQEACTKNPESLIYTFSAKLEPERVPEGSYRGTQLALTKVYDLIEQRYLHRTFCPAL